MLARVLDDARKSAIELRGGGLSDEELQELNDRLGRVIMQSFEAGTTDPEVLKRLAVESLER